MYTPRYSSSPYVQLEQWADELNTLQNLRDQEEKNLKKCSEQLQQYANLETRLKELFTKVGGNYQLAYNAETLKLSQLKTELEETLSQIKTQEKTVIGQINYRYPMLTESDINQACLSTYSRDLLTKMIQEKAQAENNIRENSRNKLTS